MMLYECNQLCKDFCSCGTILLKSILVLALRSSFFLSITCILYAQALLQQLKLNKNEWEKITLAEILSKRHFFIILLNDDD